MIHSLAGGGAERTAAEMANHWADSGDRVTLVTLDSAESDRYQLSPAVEREALKLMRDSPNPLAAIRNNIGRIRRLRRVIRQSAPEHVLSFTEKMNILVLLACAGLGVRTIVAERTDPRHHHVGRVWSFLRRRLYPSSGAIVVQTVGVREVVRKLAGRRPVYVIPNSVKPPKRLDEARPQPAKSERRIVTAGRLAREKGFDLAIEAFARVAGRHPDWKLQILGEGPDRDDLERLIQNHGLQDRIGLPGWISDPSAMMLTADLFVLPSRYEGFPNALLEAMACGLPTISFRCESGPADIVRDGHDGLLVPAEDVEALAAAMDRLMSDHGQRDRLAERAVDVAWRFSEELFFKRWEAVLDGIPEDDTLFVGTCNESVT